MGFSDRQVVFEINPPASRVNHYLAEATVNLHTMVDEHFGIGRVFLQDLVVVFLLTQV